MAQEAQDTKMPVEVILRRFDLSDLDAFMAWASDDRVSAFCSWDTYTSPEPLLAYMRDTVLPHPWFRAICLAGDGAARPVGAVSVTPPGDGAGDRCRAELGYVVAAAHWGRGVATAAVKAAARTAFAEMEGLERVEALVDVENVASQRVLEKAGFQREGVLRRYWVQKGRVRDMAVYSFISTDPVAD